MPRACLSRNSSHDLSTTKVFSEKKCVWFQEQHAFSCVLSALSLGIEMTPFPKWTTQVLPNHFLEGINYFFEISSNPNPKAVLFLLILANVASSRKWCPLSCFPPVFQYLHISSTEQVPRTYPGIPSSSLSWHRGIMLQTPAERGWRRTGFQLTHQVLLGALHNYTTQRCSENRQKQHQVGSFLGFAWNPLPKITPGDKE